MSKSQSGSENALGSVGDHRCREVGGDAIEQRGGGFIGTTKGIGLSQTRKLVAW